MSNPPPPTNQPIKTGLAVSGVLYFFLSILLKMNSSLNSSTLTVPWSTTPSPLESALRDLSSTQTVARNPFLSCATHSPELRSVCTSRNCGIGYSSRALSEGACEGAGGPGGGWAADGEERTAVDGKQQKLKKDERFCGFRCAGGAAGAQGKARDSQRRRVCWWNICACALRREQGRCARHQMYRSGRAEGRRRRKLGNFAGRGNRPTVARAASAAPEAPSPGVGEAPHSSLQAEAAHADAARRRPPPVTESSQVSQRCTTNNQPQ